MEQKGTDITHKAVLIAEIFQNICLWSRRRDLPALAQCCRAFQELALRELWYKIHDLNPLLNCLPDDVLEVEVDRAYRELVGARCQLAGITAT